MTVSDVATAETEVIGINLFGKLSLEEGLRLIRRCGYGAVDYSASAGRLAGDRDALRQARALTRDLGLVAAATHYRSFGHAFLAPGQARDAFLRAAPEDIRAAAYLGAPVVTFHLGADLATDRANTDAGLAAANAEVLREAVHVAEQEGVSVALENHHAGWGITWEHLEAVAALLDSSAVGFTLDSGHAVAGGQRPEVLARAMGARLLNTHLHDNDGRQDTHRPAGTSGANGQAPGGTINWPVLVAALRATGYPQRAAWLLEGGTQIPGDDPALLLERHIACFRPLLQRST